jgi:hypothetical protein
MITLCNNFKLAPIHSCCVEYRLGVKIVFKAWYKIRCVPKAVPWLRRLVPGLSPRMPGFASGSVRVGFVWKNWHWDRFLSEFFRFPQCLSFHCGSSPLIYISRGEWTINPLVAAVQRHHLILSTWATKCCVSSIGEAYSHNLKYAHYDLFYKTVNYIFANWEKNAI